MAVTFERLVSLSLLMMGAYAGLGLLFALWFVFFAIARVDKEARGTGIGFRLIIIPGVTALWPIFFRRLLRGMPEPPIERNAHR